MQAMKPNECFFLSPREETRFWSNVDILGLDECWPWRGGIDGIGYGLFYTNQERHRAHRVAWTVCFGLITPGLNILHHCDNRPCCNPCHLFEGTHAQNMSDMARKGRGTHGVRSWTAKLDWEKARQIRAEHRPGILGFGHKSLAIKYGVSKSSVKGILDGKYWNPARINTSSL